MQNRSSVQRKVDEQRRVHKSRLYNCYCGVESRSETKGEPSENNFLEIGM